MSVFHEIQEPEEINILIAFADLANFARASRNHKSGTIFDFLSRFYELCGDIIEGAGGMIVKFIGDAAMIAFPESLVNRGTKALLELQDAVESWLKTEDFSMGLRIQAHYGPVTAGPIGTRKRKSFDVMGDTVNIAAMLKVRGIAVTPQLFRALDTENRRYFKKHTPPISYIGVKESHRD